MEHVALLRGVNVGGVKVVMADLRRLAAALGWQNPQTYIASGNLLFTAPAGDHAPALEAALRAAYGREVPVIVRDAHAMRATLAACPFEPEEGRHVHVFFLWTGTTMDRGIYESARRPSEELVVQDRLAWLHAPEGIGRSTLAETLHRVLPGTQMTARNLNTLRSLVEMLDARAGG